MPSAAGGHAATEYATSQTVLKALDGLGRFRGGTFRACWLVSIAERIVVDRYRCQRPEVGIDEALPVASAEVIHDDAAAQLDLFGDITNPSGPRLTTGSGACGTSLHSHLLAVACGGTGS